MSGDLKLNSSEATEREHTRWWNQQIFYGWTVNDFLLIALIGVVAFFLYDSDWDKVFGLRP